MNTKKKWNERRINLNKILLVPSHFPLFFFLLISSGDDVGEDLVMLPEVKRKLEEGKSLSLIDTDTVTAVTLLILYLFSLLSWILLRLLYPITHSFITSPSFSYSPPAHLSPISLCIATSYLSSRPSPLYPSTPPSISLPFSLLVSSLLFMSTHVLSYRLISCHVSASYEFKIDRGGGEAREYAQTTECNQQRPPQGKSLLHIADVVIALVSILFYNVYIMLYYAILYLSHIIFILYYFRSWKHQCTRETKTKKN